MSCVFILFVSDITFGNSTIEAVADRSKAMESRDHFKNGARPAKPSKQEKHKK